MGREEYLIDTNTTIQYIAESLPNKALSFLDKLIDDRFYISVVNKIELLGFNGISENEELKFKEFINAAFILDLEREIVENTIDLRKSYKIKLPDAIIASSAIVNDLTLLSRNTKDFDKI